MKQYLLAMLVAALTVVSTAASAQWFGSSVPDDLSSRGYTRGEARHYGRISDGTVLAVREVKLEPSPVANAAGSGLGAVLGGLLGNKVGNGNGQIAGAAVGALIGAVAGKAVTAKVADERATEIVIRLANGQVVGVTQSGADGATFAPGQSVMLVETANGVRVTAKTFQEPTATTPPSGASGGTAWRM